MISVPKTIYLAIYFSFFSSSDSSRSYTHLEPQTLSSVSFPRQNWSGWCFRLDRVSGHLTILRGRGEEDMEHYTDPAEVKGSSWGDSILCEQASYSFGKKKKSSNFHNTVPLGNFGKWKFFYNCLFNLCLLSFLWKNTFCVARLPYHLQVMFSQLIHLHLSGNSNVCLIMMY